MPSVGFSAFEASKSTRDGSENLDSGNPAYPMVLKSASVASNTNTHRNIFNFEPNPLWTGEFSTSLNQANALLRVENKSSF